MVEEEDDKGLQNRKVVGVEGDQVVVHSHKVVGVVLVDDGDMAVGVEDRIQDVVEEARKYLAAVAVGRKDPGVAVEVGRKDLEVEVDVYGKALFFWCLGLWRG
ncbi:hypothetical protein F2P56_000730 [Juglans regia]|uniref:Uncharacterized protein n=1 Tax=Juglans regia TaxID=51240 RepID=A0A834D3D3_JUGRE|nr:hypothetical protein F2P56_000730 [Juglans regia]